MCESKSYKIYVFKLKLNAIQNLGALLSFKKTGKFSFEMYFLSILTLTIHICFFDNIDCLPGYIGMNCSSKCPFPTYGIKCQEICNCSKEQCDVATGCNTVTTGNVHLYK